MSQIVVTYSHLLWSCISQIGPYRLKCFLIAWLIPNWEDGATTMVKYVQRQISLHSAGIVLTCIAMLGSHTIEFAQLIAFNLVVGGSVKTLMSIPKKFYSGR